MAFRNLYEHKFEPNGNHRQYLHAAADFLTGMLCGIDDMLDKKPYGVWKGCFNFELQDKNTIGVHVGLNEGFTTKDLLTSARYAVRVLAVLQQQLTNNDISDATIGDDVKDTIRSINDKALYLRLEASLSHR